MLEALKQIAFYTDAYGECRWSRPEQSIKEETAKRFVALSTRGEAMTTEPELELWVKHLRPVWKSSAADMKYALATCYAEAEALGVLPGTARASDMVTFLY